MATVTATESPPKKSIEILGFVVKLKNRLKHSLYIEYGIDHAEFAKISERLDKSIVDKEQEFLLNTPLKLEEGSVLVLKLTRGLVWSRENVTATAGFSKIWQHLETMAPAESESRFKVYEDEKKQIWSAVKVRQDSVNGSGQLPVDALKAAQSEIDTAVKKLEEFKTALHHLGKAKGTFDITVKLGRVVAELHPVSKLVMGCVNVIYQQLKIPGQSRDQMLTLAKGVGSLAESVKDTEGIAKSATLKKTLDEFPGFMIEVANFISRWLGSWTERIPFSDSEDKINEFSQRLGALEKEFPRGLLVDIRIAQELKVLEDTLVGGLEFRPLEKECMPGTRTDILLKITTKLGGIVAYVPDAQEKENEKNNVIWIKGYPGVGKSTLAASVVAVLRNLDRLGSYFIFERAYSSTATTNSLCRRVALKLTSKYPSARQFLLENITKADFDPQIRNIESLFNTLIKEPLLALIESKDIPDGHSPAFVIDALDECGGLEGSQSEDRKSLLQIIKLWQQHIPKEFKLVVTSRVEDDISRVLDDISIPIHIPSGSNHTSASEADIRLYFQSTLQKLVPKIPSLRSSSEATSWIEEVSNTLAPRAAGVFIWATTAAKFLERNPRRHYEQILNQGLDATKSVINGIYSLYSTILEISFKDCPDDEARAFVSVVSAAVVAKQPLGNGDLTKLPGVDIDMLEVIRRGLESVIDPSSNTFRFVHQSFVDFLLSPKSGCPPHLAIDESSAQCQLAELCLHTMQSELCFNICGLETSTQRNTDIPDLSVRIQNNISSLLSYSCSFWANHLSQTPFSKDRMGSLKEVVNEKLLFWFECMSLMKEMVRVSPALRQILNWSKSDGLEDEILTKLVHDALRFVAIFNQPIRESAPHIYISALSFSPESSQVAKHFSCMFPNIIAVTEGRPTHWPLYKFVVHDQLWVACIAFSPDRKSFACGDRNGTIFLRDSETGSLISSPFEMSPKLLDPNGQGLGNEIVGLWFGPDGKQIAARTRSGHVQLWEVDSHKTWWLQSHQCWSLQKRSERAQIQWTEDGKHIIITHFDDLPHMEGTLKRVKCTAYGGELIEDSFVMFTLPQAWRDKGYLGFMEFVFSWDGRYMVSVPGFPGSKARSVKQEPIRLWSLDDGTCQDIYQFPSQGLDQESEPQWCQTVAFTSDSQFVTGCLSDVTLIIWSVKDGSIIKQFQNPQTHISDLHIYFPSNHILILHSGSHLEIWSMESEERLYYFEVGGIGIMSLSDDGEELLIVSGEAVSVLSLDGVGSPSSAHLEDTLIKDQSKKNLRNARFHACSGEKLFFTSDHDGPDGTITLRVYDSSTNSILPSLAPIKPQFCPRVIAVSPDGKYILLSSHKLAGAFQIWDAQSGRLIAQPIHEQQQEEIEENPTPIEFVFRSTDQRLITFSFGSRTVTVWSEDMTRQEICQTLKRAPGNPCVTQVSPDGSTAFIGKGGKERLWRLTADNTHFERVQHAVSHGRSFNDVAYSPSGEFIAISEDSFDLLNPTDRYSTIELWRIAESGNLVAHGSLKIDGACARAQAISPKFNEHVILSLNDSTMQIWNAATGKFTSSQPWHIGSGPQSYNNEKQLVFLGSGDRLASQPAKSGVPIKIWDMTNLGDLESPGVLKDDTEIKDGWAMGRDGELLFWVPPEHRDILWRPRNVAMIGPSTRLDFTNFKYGDKWAECIDEKYRK